MLCWMHLSSANRHPSPMRRHLKEIRNQQQHQSFYLQSNPLINDTDFNYEYLYVYIF